MSIYITFEDGNLTSQGSRAPRATYGVQYGAPDLTWPTRFKKKYHTWGGGGGIVTIHEHKYYICIKYQNAIMMPEWSWVDISAGRMLGVGQMHVEVPWESLFGPKMKIYLEIPHSEQLWCYEKKIWSLVIFLTLFVVKIAHFCTILTKNCFCSNDQNIWTKLILNSILNLFLNNFCS